jgi:hypothetical protein
MNDQEMRKVGGEGRKWVMYAGRPCPKPADPRERWRREWIGSWRPV